MKEKISLTAKEKRNSGIDLLRMVLMFMVIYLHMAGLNVDNRLLCNTDYMSVKGGCFYTITAFCMVAVNTFVIISGYFGIQHEAKYHKAVEYWLQGLFYNIVITLAYVYISGVFNPFDTSVFLISIVGRNIWWFLSAFILLTLLKPFLNIAISKMSLTALKKFVAIMILITVIYPDLIQGINYVFGKNLLFYTIVESGFNWIWFVCLYIIGATLKRIERQGIKKMTYLCKYLACIFACIGLSYGLSVWLQSSTLITYFMRYTSLFMTLGGVYLFKFFLHLEIKNKIFIKILSLSKYTFGIYLFHEHPYIRMWLEEKIYTKLPYMNSVKIVLVVLSSMISIYIIGIAIDMVRLKLFSWLQLDRNISSLSRKVNDKWNRYMNEEISYEK